MSEQNIFIYWDSRSPGTLLLFEDQEKTIPMNLTDVPLLWMGKKRFADADENAVFTLSIGDGLTLDDTPDNNQLSFIIPPMATTSLSRTKNTTLWTELLANPTDPEFRRTLYQRELPVRPSIKDLTE